MIFVVLLHSACAGCGGGSGGPGGSPPPPPTPAQDFSISVSSNAINLQQGTTSSALTVSVKGQNGFTASVQVSLSGLPKGVQTNPPGPFSLAVNSSAPVVLGAALTAPTGNFIVTVAGISGNLSHSTTLTLTLQAAVMVSSSRTAYVRTDAIPSLDVPPGELRHRHLAYDFANKHLFVANRAGNCVDVFSTVDQSRLARINVPAATSADLSADGTTVWVGTAIEQIVAIDAVALQIRNRYAIAGLSPIPNTIFDRPIEVLTFSNGKEAVRLRQPDSSEALLALWDSGGNTPTNLTPAAPPLFQNGVGPMARTGDHNKLLVAANDSSGEIGVFDGNGAIVAGPQTLGAGTIPLVAANLDGSRFAVVFTLNGITQILLLDGGLLPAGTHVTSAVHGITFSRDGAFLYVSENVGVPPVITVLDGHDLHAIGQVPDPAIQDVRSEIEEGDEVQLLFAAANRGVSFIDASMPGTLPATAPAFADAPSAQPAEGTIVGGAAVTLFGQNFEPTAQVRFGTQLAPAASVSGGTQIATDSPASVVNGGVNLSTFFPSGWLAITPDAFSYGPQILEVLPNAAAKGGGNIVQIYGYGFGSDASRIRVSVGGASATVQSVGNVTSLAASLGLDVTFPFSLERITLQTPSGAAGEADLSVASPAGSVSMAKFFQYLQSVQVFPKAGLFKFALYDQDRQRVYLSATDHVDVFDLKTSQWLFPPTQAFEPSGLLPPGGPPPNAGLRGLALTPDDMQLVVADFGAQNVYLLNPDPSMPGGPGSGTTVFVGGVSGFLNSGPARVAATSAQTVFVGLSGEGGGSGGCSACLNQMNLTVSPPTVQPAPQPQVASLTGAPLLQASASGNRVYFAFTNAPGGPLAAWDAATPNQFTTLTAHDAALDLANAADGSMFAARANGTTEIRGQDFTLFGTPATVEREGIPSRVNVPGITLHPSGALVYQPFLTGSPPAAPPATGIRGGIDILDAHSGELRLRIFLPEPLAMLSSDVDGLHGGFLAVDENGQRLFALTTSGLTVVQLANVPLGIGSISPSSSPAAGGTSITIRGSGFQSGIQGTIGGKTAVVTFTDMNTLTLTTPALNAGSQQIVLTNPDGETVSLDAAFLAN
jgi:IPT/TIG domain-containing protein